MTSISPASGQIIQQTPVNKLSILPKDTLYKIFSYLCENDIQVAVCLNKELSKDTKESINNNQVAPMRVFISSSNAGLSKVVLFEVQAQQLHEMLANIPVEFTN